MHMVILGAGRGLINTIRAVRPLAKRITVVVPSSNDTGIDALIRRMGPFPGAATALQIIQLFGTDAAAGRLMQQVFPPFGTPYDHVPFAVLDTMAHALALGSLSEAIQRLRGITHCELDVLLASEQVHDVLVRGDSPHPEPSSIYFGRPHTGAVQSVTLDPPVDAHAAVIHALKTADAVVIAPGALYRDVLPTLMPEGIAETLRSMRGRVLCIAGLTTVPSQTDAFRAVDYVARIARALGRGAIDVALLNTQGYGTDELAILRSAKSTPMRYEAGDREVLDALGVGFVGRDLRAPRRIGAEWDVATLTSHDELELRMGCMMALKDAS
ncbi:MAG: hypothetical protein RLY87_1173 [Chloroflexota bacterium]|jgi:uncharacterized cofD-like protein